MLHVLCVCVCVCVCVGGMGAFVLAVFHKLEISTRTKKIRECCTFLRRRTDDDVRNFQYL